MELNYIYKFDFNILFNSKVDNGILKCSSSACNRAREKVTKRESLLFDQIKQIKDESLNLEELLVIIDFSSFIKKNMMTDIGEIKAIELSVYKANDNDKKERRITVRDFLISNSMSKECQVYYLNCQANDKDGYNLYDSLKKRVFESIKLRRRNM